MTTFPTEFVDRLATISAPHVFNPYSDVCPHHDLPDAPETRRSHLHRVLTAAVASKVDVLWVGLELGRKGGRRTGLPLTDEPHLDAMGRYWSLGPLAQATMGDPVPEETAGCIWQAVAESPKRVFFWNIFPLQCHQPDAITNRRHTLEEARQVADLLPWLMRELSPSEVVALGHDAQKGLKRLGIPARYVRHPARQGTTKFLAGIHG